MDKCAIQAYPNTCIFCEDGYALKTVKLEEKCLDSKILKENLTI